MKSGTVSLFVVELLYKAPGLPIDITVQTYHAVLNAVGFAVEASAAKIAGYETWEELVAALQAREPDMSLEEICGDWE